MAKETVEEAVENAWALYEFDEGNLYSTSFKGGFRLGVKWQEQRTYTEEDLAKAYDLGVEQCAKRGGVYSRAITDWDELKEQFKKL